MRKRKQVFVLAGLVLTGGAIAGFAVWARDWPAHHFAVVEEGVLYRSGQPTAGGWQAIQDRYQIRTVVNLRRFRPDADWWKAETAFCRRSGIELVHLPIGPDGVTDEQWGRFLGIVTDPSRQPVLVHCMAGSVRTGVMVAGYRIAVQGWNCRDAVGEAETLRFRAKTHKGYVDFLKRLAADAGPVTRTKPRPVGCPPTEPVSPPSRLRSPAGRTSGRSANPKATRSRGPTWTRSATIK